MGEGLQPVQRLEWAVAWAFSKQEKSKRRGRKYIFVLGMCFACFDFCFDLLCSCLLAVNCKSSDSLLCCEKL